MIQKQLPSPLLQPFVKEYWLLNLAIGSVTPLRMSPSPEQCLYFYPRSQPIPFDSAGKHMRVFDNLMMGQSLSSDTQLIIPDGYRMFKILFQPGGMFRLFGVPMSLLANTYEETSAVLGRNVEEVREQICNANNLNEMALFSDDFMIRQLTKTKHNIMPIDRAITQQSFHLSRIDQLASDSCLSNRQFERKFLERVGVSPKIYQRIIRFNQAMKLKDSDPNRKWIEIAYACGYFDQMHLLRDFKQFTGSVPSNFDFNQAVIY